MESFDLNKAFCALLTVIFGVFTLSIFSDSLFGHDTPEQFGYEVEVAEKSTGGAGGDAGPAFDPIAPVLASADAAKGEAIFKKCASCHSVDKGGANKVGPALYGVVGRDIASKADYGYSGGLTEFGAGKQWTFEELNGFLWKPKKYVKGTSMGFAGIKKVEDRANLITYLNSASDSPLAAPAAEAPAAEAEKSAY